MLENAYNRKEYTLPSGKQIYLQGYENFMLDYLLSDEKICEDDIITKRKDIPEIWINDKNGKKKDIMSIFTLKVKIDVLKLNLRLLIKKKIMCLKNKKQVKI